MSDDNIDLSESPEMTPEMFARATLRHDGKPVTRPESFLQLDPDVLAWFKAQGQGYKELINSILRAYKEAHQES